MALIKIDFWQMSQVKTNDATRETHLEAGASYEVGATKQCQIEINAMMKIYERVSYVEWSQISEFMFK